MSRIDSLKCLKSIVLTLTCGVVFQAVFVQAQTTISVPADFATIQAAINASADGDTILVAAGTYQENISFLGKAIHVTSEDGPATTFLDGNQTGSVVSFVDGEGANSIIEGFTIINGSGTFVSGPNITSGGGVFVTNAGSPSIIGNVITDNTSSTGNGGGIGCFQATATVDDNSISGNNGGGIYATDSSQTMTITNNSINTNSSNEGINVDGVAVVVVEKNTVFGNGGDGIKVCNCDMADLIDNTVLAGPGEGIVAQLCGQATAIGNYIEGRTGGGSNGLNIRDADFTFSEQNICGNNADRGHFYRNTPMVICRNNISVENGTEGITIRDCSAFVDGVTVFGNPQGGFTSVSNDFLDIRNSIFRNNGSDEIQQFLGGASPSPEYCNIQGGFFGVGNIDVDPLFVDFNGPDNNPQTISDNDYRLQAGSLCIDAGD